MERYLIINADDFGMCHAGNLAVFDLLQKGGITSATIMAPCPWAKEAALFAAKHPEFAIGLHLTTTSEWGTYRWGPVSRGDVSSLIDEEGFMWHESDQFEKAADLAQVEAEIDAQYDRLAQFGFTPSHFDNHMGTLYGVATGRFELLEVAIRACAKHGGMPFRFPSKFTDEQFINKTLDIQVPKEVVLSLLDQVTAGATAAGVAVLDYLMPGDWDGPQRESYENYREYIFEKYRAFPEGIIETYIHPVIECEEVKAICGSWQRRNWEYKLFSDPKTREFIESIGIKLINYRDLKRMRFGA